MARSCSNCGKAFSTLNPLRGICDECRRQQANSASVLLGTAENELEANIWRDVLAQAGIGCAFRQTDAVASRWQGTPMPFSVEVLVQARDLERALALIEAPSAEPDASARRYRRRR